MAPERSKAVIIPLDGGWGWMIVLACFLAHVIIDGIFYSFGIVFVEFLDYFQHGRGDTAWISAIATAVPYVIGPVAGVLTDRFGCRVVTIVGGLIGCLGFVLSIFAPNLYFLYFSIGILVGSGYGLVYFASIVCVTTYFEKKRALATGLAVCGAGVGTFIFNPLSAVLIEQYKLKGTLLIEAGIMLNCCVIGALYRPIEQNRTTNKTSSSYDEYELMLKVEVKGEDKKTVSDQNVASQEEENINCSSSSKFSDKGLALTRDDKTVPKSTRHAKEGSSNGISDIAKVKGGRDKHTGKGIAWLWIVIVDNLHLSLYRNIPFLFMLISFIIYGLFFYMPYIYMADFAREEGIPTNKSAWVLSTIGIANIAGRVTFGLLSDRKWVNRILLYSMALIICGIVTALVPVLNTFETLLIFAALFGVFSGVTVVLLSVILVDLVGLSALTDAFGISNLYGGLTGLIGTPIAGWIFDSTGSYLWSFLAAGIGIVLSGVLMLPVLCLRRFARDADRASERGD